ncbi:lamin tail domain-containing protein [Bacteroidota bacterium]
MQKQTSKFTVGLLSFLFLISSFPKIAIGQTETLRINEFMAINQTTLTDENGEYSDWIEIFNPTASAISLLDYTLTDDISQVRKWIFPDITIASNEYLVLFASGKDRAIAGSELHTNFKISGSGEYLALFNPDSVVITEFNPAFPIQQADISYGFFNNSYIGFSDPTPGLDNTQSGATILPPPVFNQNHGFFESAFNLEITSEIQSAEIYYTTDGSVPSTSNGTLYSSPINIQTTSVIRAITHVDRQNASKVTTQTFLFIDDVIHQPNNPAGYPAEWGPYFALDGMAIADYEMDPEMMADTEFANSVKEALLDLSTISLVTDIDNLFLNSEDPETGGIYIYTGPPIDHYENDLGQGWERPVSFEYFDANDSVSLQVDCGVRLQGGHSRRSEKSPKHSFRLIFRSEYGPTKLNFPIFGEDAASSFNNFSMRAGFCNTWIHHATDQRDRAQYIRDSWGKDAQLALGHVASHNNFAHLYLNGIYWGLYNPTERLDKDFAAAYLEGSDEDFDVIKDYTEVVDGEITAWNNMMTLARSGMESNEAYQMIQGNNPDGSPNYDYEAYVDVVNLIDYMIINFYGGNTDWDQHNWAAARNRVNPGKGFKFFSWDAEHILKNVDEYVLNKNNTNCPSELFQILMQNEDFQRLFSDRVQKHCFGNGILTPESASERWMERSNQVEKAVLAESARWGDYRRDVHPYQTSGPFDLYTKEAHWLTQQDYMLNTYFPERTNAFINQLRNESLFPNTDAPNLMINDSTIDQNVIADGDVLTMSVTEGTIYYTTNGTDPAIWQLSQESEETILIEESADKKVIVPKSDIGTTWSSDINYDDASWQTCSGIPGGIGYEMNSGYENLITLDVGNDMHEDGINPNPSCYIRIPFDITADELSSFTSLTLSVSYDDGFVAFLNGTKVAEMNAPETIAWNSIAPENHEADFAESFNISEFINNLVEGNNLLAIQGINVKSSSDFFISASLKASDQPPSGGASPDASLYSSAITINESSHIKARAFHNNEWSALSDEFLIIPDDYNDIKITEIHYHPHDNNSIDGDKFEFIELKNTGASTLDIGGLKFVKGIEFEFPAETELGAGEFIVLAASDAYFYSRYSFESFDDYKGQLDNNGEKIVLVSPTLDTLCSIRYYDNDLWPDSVDGLGHSLVPMDLNPSNDQNNPVDWRKSYNIGGSPGKDDLDVDPDPIDPDPVYPVNLISIYSSQDTIFIGDILQLSLSILPSYATNKEVTWSVSDEIIASITSEGVLTAKETGTILVTATAKDGSGITGTKYIYIESITDINGFTAFDNIKVQQNYPNPFSDVTYIDYYIPTEAHVQISVYNFVGQNIATLINNRQLEGFYQVEWNGVDEYNNNVANGIYFYKMQIKNGNLSKEIINKMVIMK